MAKIDKSILNYAVKFHGHLGPYLILGLLMGDHAIKLLQCKKHFGIEVTVKGVTKRPKSCLIDGIQISTGCTYGKGNIKKINAKYIEATFRNLKNKDQVKVRLSKDLIRKLDSLEGHGESEQFARKLFTVNPVEIFELNILR